jgi:hypothetical protein
VVGGTPDIRSRTSPTAPSTSRQYRHPVWRPKWKFLSPAGQEHCDDTRDLPLRLDKQLPGT